MPRRLSAILAALGALAAAPSVAAATAPPAYLTRGAPVATYEDAHGTSFVLVQDSLYFPVLYRRPAGASKWTKTRIPNMPGNYFWKLTAPTSGELWISAEKQNSTGGDGDTIVSRSTDGGRTWHAADVSRFASGGSLGIGSMAIVGRLVAQVRFTAGGGGFVRLHPDLQGFDPWPAGAPAHPLGASVAGDGTLMMWSTVSDRSFSVWSGGHTAGVSFPCALSTGFAGPTVAVGKSSLVMLAACRDNGRVYVRQVSSAGVVSAAVRLGATTRNGAQIAASAGPGTTFAAVWNRPTGGDFGVARSTSGRTWKVAAGVLPLALPEGGVGSALVVGNAFVAFVGPYPQRTYTAPLTSTVRPPKAPTRGISHPLTLRSGTAVGVLGARVGLAALKRTGTIVVHVAVSVTEPISISVTTNRAHSGYIYLYTGSAKVKVRAGHTAALVIHLHAGGVVIGGGGSGLPLTDVRRGDSVTVVLSNRNGLVTRVAKVV